jgi:signal transduction histidine kinase
MKIKVSYIIAGAFVALIVALAFFVQLYLDTAADRDRIKQNQSLLLHNGTVEISETGNGNSHASAPALTLRPSEFKESGDTLAKVARQVGIKPSRISEAATAATSTSATITTPVWHSPDTASIPADSLHRPDSLICFSWHDSWLSLSGCVSDSLFRGSVSSTDTLDIIVHRIPKRFLFFRFGCKQVRMDIISRNPHTRLTYARYYQLVK